MNYHTQQIYINICLQEMNYYNVKNLGKTTSVSDYHISDHWTVTCLSNLDKPSVTRKTVTFKKTKGVDLAALSNELSSSTYARILPTRLASLLFLQHYTFVYFSPSCCTRNKDYPISASGAVVQ